MFCLHPVTCEQGQPTQHKQGSQIKPTLILGAKHVFGSEAKLYLSSGRYTKLYLSSGRYTKLYLNTARCTRLYLNTGRYTKLYFNTGRCTRLYLNTGRYTFENVFLGIARTIKGTKAAHNT
jgi:hypothetical protein